MKLRLKFWALSDRAWVCTSDHCILIAEDPESAWRFARAMLSGYKGCTSIHHVRDPLRAALTHQRFSAILKEFGSGRPVAFGSVENPKSIMTVEIPT